MGFFCWFIIVVLLTCVCAGVRACVRACMHVLRACVCVRETERDSDTQTETETQREGCMGLCVCVCVYNFIPIHVETNQQPYPDLTKTDTVFTISHCC